MDTMKAIMASAIAVALIGGCGTTYYVNPGVTQEQADRDMAYCNMMAQQGAGVPMDYAGAAMSGLNIRKIRDYCMQSKGYHQQ